MKIIRWLLSHIFLILLIVVVIYSYMFWGDLAGKETPAGKAIAYLSSEFVEVEEFVNAVKAKQAQLSGKSSTQDDNDQKQEQEQELTANAEASPDIEQNSASISYSHNQTKMKQNASAAVVVIEAPVKSGQTDIWPSKPVDSSDASLTNPQAEVAVNNAESIPANEANVEATFVSPDVAKQLDNVDVHGKVVDAAQQSAKIRATWIVARKSYYQRNYQLSEKSYQQVIDNTEDNFDAYGELGNVYFNQGKRSQAASAYYEAAAILVRRGEVARARSLMGLLRHLDKSKAEELKELIHSASS